jgi:hypothetical protein
LNPQFILLAIEAMQFARQFGAPAAQAIIKAVYTPAPTQADWDAAFALATKHTDKFLEDTKNLPGAMPTIEIPA